MFEWGRGWTAEDGVSCLHLVEQTKMVRAGLRFVQASRQSFGLRQVNQHLSGAVLCEQKLSHSGEAC
jgi:hypothetical protein